jgi:hypothetical protein
MTGALLNPVILALAGALLSLLVRKPDGLRGAWAWYTRPLILAGFVLLAGIDAALHIGIGYLVPWDFSQEIAAVSHFDETGSFYSDDIRQDLHDAIAAPRPLESLLPTPVLSWVRHRREIQPDFFVAQAHPPVLLTLARPVVHLLGPSSAFLACSAMTVAAALLAAWALLAWADVPTGSRAWQLGLVLVIGWQPVLASLSLGQVSVVLGALVIGAWAAARRERDLLAGTLLGLAAAIKVYPLLFFPFLLMRRPRAAMAGLAMMALTVIATGLASGFGQFTAFWQAARSITREFGAATNNYALWARLAPLGEWVHSPWFMGSIVALFTAATAVVAALRWRPAGRWSPQCFDLDAGAFACLTTVLSPVSWQHYFFMLLLPLAVTLRLVLASGSTRAAVAWCLLAAVLSVSDAPFWAVAGLFSGPGRLVALVASPTTAVLALWAWCLLARPHPPAALPAFQRL